MESRQAIKNRIKSIEGTQQITKSMRLVAMSKMQKAKERMNENLVFLDESCKLVHLAKRCMEGEEHPYIDGRLPQNTLVVIISGDRGLCGGYNAGIIRYALHYIEGLGRPIKVVTIGSKVSDAFKRRQSYRPIHAFKGISDSPMYSEAAEIAEIVRAQFDSGEVDEVLLCYTRFVSMLSQEPEVARLLPLDENVGAAAESDMLTFEPGGASMLENVVSFYLTSRIFGAILESAVSEQSARILSMDGAARTAGDMIGKLTLRYNQVRQGAITQELTEIVAGADAVGG